ncbi:MAG: hypothetical protein R3C44_14255 [Chloroflexota bacterium]
MAVSSPGSNRGRRTAAVRLPDAEASVATGINEATIAAAATAAQAATRHPGDFRGDAAYRAEMAAVLTWRVLQALANQA